MSLEAERVVVIQDASRDASTSAIKKALKQLSLKPGDQLTLLAILVNYKSKLDSSSSFVVATEQKIGEEELVKKKKEDFCKSPQILKLYEYCETKNIVFHIEVLAGSSPEVASNAAKNFRATWLILDRQMNKHKRHFMENLSCGMYRIRSHRGIQRLRKPKLRENTKSLAQRSDQVTYMEMIPGSSEEEFSLKRPRSSLSNEQLMAAAVSTLQNSKASNSKHKEEENPPKLKHKTTEKKKHSVLYISESKETEVHLHVQQEFETLKEEFANSICSVCENKRPKIGWKRDFSYSELYTATHGFSQKNFLSEGGFGSVYKGQLDGMAIAVKQHKCASLQGEKEFKSEVNLLSKARHENVVMLLGSCSEGNNRLLVYEYVCNGSLDQHLSQHSRAVLSWEDRIKVAIGSAKGLLYLHKNNIIHRDMRTNNILITHDYQPLLGDFGLARSQHQDSIHSTEVVGTLGYLAPEYAECGKVSTKIDVYSFGVILLQLITGMRITDQRLEGRSLVGWARPLLRERNYPELIDQRIINSNDFHQLFWMVRIAEKCLSRDPHKRLTMISVVEALTHIVDGQICGIISRDISFVRSESLYDSSDTDTDTDGSSEDEMNKSEGEIESPDKEFNATSNSSMSHMISGLPIPPSPPMDTTSSCRLGTIMVYDQSGMDIEELNESDGIKHYAKMEE